MSGITVVDCEVTTAACAKFLQRLPLKLMSPRKSYRKDLIHHKQFTEMYKADILTCASLLKMPSLSTCYLRKMVVAERLAMIHAYIATDCQEEVTYDSELLADVKKRMNGEVDWQGILDMCMFSEDMDVGDDNDAQSKRIHRTSRTKLLSTMRIIGLDKGLLHWEIQRRLIHDAIAIVHSFNIVCML
jgi:hypothetical protein